MSPDKEPLALSEPLKLLDDDAKEVPEDSFSEPVIDNGLHNDRLQQNKWEVICS